MNRNIHTIREMRNYLNILFLTCFCVGGFSTQVTAQQASIEAIHADINQGTHIIYANSGTDISSAIVNRSNTWVPSGDVIGVMISVNGDTPTLVSSKTLADSLITYGNWPTTPTQTPFVQINNPGYVFNPARFSGGGGLVHDIIIWPTKIAGGNTTVITSDTQRIRALYINAAAFRVTNSDVLGLAGTLNLETIYPQINAIAENVGLSANTQDLEFFIKLDDFPAKRIGTTSTAVDPGKQYGMVIPNFRIRDYYPILPINQAFRGSAHLLQVYAREKNLVNTIGIAEFMVDASNSFPVELLAFDGYMDNHKVQINWASSNERNNSHFIVQKYLHTQEVYTNIGRVEGVGFSDTINHYQITDLEPVVGINTYRLIQVDIDGTAIVTGQTLEIRYQLGGDKMEMVQAYPNPFASSTNLQVRIPEAGAARVEVYDVMGKRVSVQHEDVQAGMNDITLSLVDHRSGTYLYRINLNGETISGKLIKQ